jgi:hypothetical protein
MGLKFPELVIHCALCADTICNLCTVEVHLEINYQFIDFCRRASVSNICSGIHDKHFSDFVLFIIRLTFF